MTGTAQLTQNWKCYKLSIPEVMKEIYAALSKYGWNSPGPTSLSGECHQNFCTLGLLTCSFLIKIACFFCVWSEMGTGKLIWKKNTLKVSQKNQKFSLKIVYHSGCDMKYTWLLKVEYLLNGCTDLDEILKLSSWDSY